MVKSKRKGNKWELWCYDQLKPIFRDLERLSGSGNRKYDKGDLRSLKAGLVFECKHCKKISRGQRDAWFGKVWKEAEAQLCNPVLLYKANYRPARTMYLIPFGDTFLRADGLFVEWKEAQK